MPTIKSKAIPAIKAAFNIGTERSMVKEGRMNRAIGARTIVVFPGDNIQKALDHLNENNGGVLFLRAGTHQITSNITGYSAIQIIGENSSSTIIDFETSCCRFYGTDVYDDGTITSITGAAKIDVEGAGTAWATDGNITTDKQISIAGRWYTIADIVDDTHLTLAEGYAGGATFPSATYRAAVVVKDIEFKELTFKNSSGTALDLFDVRNVFIEDCSFSSNNKAIKFTNVSEVAIDNVIAVSSVDNGAEFNNVDLCTVKGFATIASGGHGQLLNSVREASFSACSSASNGTTPPGDGWYIINCDQIALDAVSASANTGQGIELVSGNSNINIISCDVSGNASDGIKLTATSDECRITDGQIDDNGAYGLNIAASTCDNNIVANNFFDNNTSGDINNSGTGTLIRDNIPDSLNDTVAPIDANYLVGTANSDLSAEIAVGTTPGGELGGTWASPTVDSTHSGSAHHAELHTVASHSDTTATGAELETLTDGSTTALHVHSSTVSSATVSNHIIFGDASDGDVTISGNTSLSRDMFYDNLTVNSGVTLTTAGYRIFVADTCTIAGTIGRPGIIAGTNGSVGSNASTRYGGNGGAGGAGTAALSSGSIFGSIT